MHITYLDHNATTPVKPAIRDLMLELLAFPGNASAIHKQGREARRRLEDARATIATALNAGPRDVIVFTSGATEANNMLFRGFETEQVFISAIEHPSIMQSAPSPRIIPVLPSGIIDLAALEGMLQGNTQQTLISVMTVNNETGVIQPIKDVVALARKYGALVHTDAVQAIGRMPFDIQDLGIDFVTLSGHKIGAPQGVGCLIIANCNAVSPLLKGGNQEKNLRAGTENLAGIAAFAKAIELADENGTAQHAAWRDKMEKVLSETVPSLRIFGKDAPRVTNTSMFSLPGASSEMQLIALDLAGICVSNGSACSSGTVKPSHVLTAMGASDAEAKASLRVSFGWNTTEKEVDFFIEQWLKMFDRIKNRLEK